jgi:hypothetical protein
MRASSNWIGAIVLGVIAAPAAVVAQEPVGTVFTYQGQLSMNGDPLTGTADFLFTLWNTDQGGDAVAGPVPVDGVEVENGLILMPVDLDVAPWTSDTATWLEIQVRSPSGAGDFVTLQPRQRVTPVPASLSTRGIAVDAAGNVGIGTPAPSAKLDVMGTALVGGFRMPPGAVGGYVLTTDDSGVANWQPAGEFTLPFDGAVASQQPAMKITNTGEGCALFGEHKLSGRFGYVGGGEAGVYGEAPDGSFGALGATIEWGRGEQRPETVAVAGIVGPDGGPAGFLGRDDESSWVRLGDPEIAARAWGHLLGGWFDGGDYGIKARGATAGGLFDDAGESGRAQVASGHHGINAYGDEMGGYFANDESAPTGWAHVGVPERGIEAYGSETGGYFADQETSPTGYAKIGVPQYGIKAYGTEGGGHFEDTAGTSETRLSHGGMGVYTSAITMAGWFEDMDGASYAQLAAGYDGIDFGIEAGGAQWGGYFEDTDPNDSGYAKVGVGDHGIRAYGDEAGGHFSGAVWGARGHVTSGGAAERYGLDGLAMGSSGTNYGVYGFAENIVGQNVSYGVYGSATSLTNGQGTNYGVYGTASNGAVDYAGYFEGDVHVTGDFSVAGTKVFRIDHPLDPENKHLYHYCLESPEVLNVYRGTVVLGADGRAWVQLPDYFAEINRDFHYQLTCVGGFAPVYVAEEIAENRFQIAGGAEGLKVCWMVTGVRDDAYVRQHGAPVELEKAKRPRDN